MEQCIHADCKQSIKYCCSCQQPPVLVCADHLTEHMKISIEHPHRVLTRNLTAEELRLLRQLHQSLETAAQESVSQVISQQQASTLERVKAIKEESAQVLNVLRKILDVGWSVLEEREHCFYGIDPVAWVLKHIQSDELRNCFEKHINDQLWTPQQIFTGSSLLQIDPTAQNSLNSEECTQTFLEYIESSLIYNNKKELNELKVVVEMISRRGVSFCNLRRTLADKSLQTYQAYELIGDTFGRHGINNAAIRRDCDEPSKVSLYEQYKRWVTDLAFASLETGTVDLQREPYSSLTTQEIRRLLEWFPVFTEDISERPATCRFLHSSIADVAVSKRTIEDLESGDTHSLSPTTSLNLYNIVPKRGIRQFLVQMMKKRPQYFEPLLLTLVLQTRKRDDITQASANAMTLLNQMGYCFARQDIRGVKIRGADLFGANLTETNFERADLQETLLAECNFMKTNLKRAKLAGAQFTAKSAFHGHSGLVTAMCFSPDGTLIASSSEHDTVIKVWEARTGREVRSLTGHSSIITAVCFSSDTTLIASVSLDSLVIVWEAGTGHQIRNFTHDESQEVMAMCFTPNGSLILCSDDSMGSLLLQTEDNLRLIKVGDKFINIAGISLSPELVTAWIGDAVKVFDLATCELRDDLGNEELDLAGAFVSSDSSLIAFASIANKLVLKETQNGQTVCTFSGCSVQAVAISSSPNGPLAATGDQDGVVVVYQAQSDQEDGITIDRLEGLSTMHLLPDASLTILESMGVKDVETDRQICTLDKQPFIAESICFTQDGTLLASSFSAASTIVWRVNTGQQVQHLNSDSQGVIALCFSPNNALLACSNEDASILVWSVASGQRVCTLTDTLTLWRVISFSPDSKLIASSGAAYAIVIWELEMSQQVRSLLSHSDKTSALCFSSDGQFIASADTDVRVWTIGTGQLIRIIKGHSKWPVKAVSFCLDSPLIAFVDSHDTLNVWDVSNGQLVRTLQSHAWQGMTVCFSSDGRFLAFRDVYGRFAVWRLSKFS